VYVIVVEFFPVEPAPFVGATETLAFKVFEPDFAPQVGAFIGNASTFPKVTL
jgi:hypothetical protein